jgi:hypothetical protein
MRGWSRACSAHTTARSRSSPEHVDIVNTLGISPADKENILWRNAAAFFNLEVAG